MHTNTREGKTMEKIIYEAPVAEINISSSVDIICDSGKTELPDLEF